jgi:uncharacterized membrane protein
MPTFKEAVDSIGLVIDGAGVLVIILGLFVATSRYAVLGFRESDGYRRFRQDLGRGILLGLEFLVAADIIRTVAVVPTLQGVLILGLIVLIRTFLSMALEVELEGRWPWQRQATFPPTPAAATTPSAAPDPTAHGGVGSA